MIARLARNERGERWVAAQAALIMGFGAGCLTGPRVELPGPLRLAGWALVCVAALAFGFAFMSLGVRNWTAMPRPTDTGELATSGAFGVVRHPIYSAAMLGAIGMVIATGRVAAAIGCLGLAAFFDLKARREERWLMSRYSGYADYATRVRRFVPGVY
jgi:protein-S-isoprenylcysteine O-methyltransferase Ste14